MNKIYLKVVVAARYWIDNQPFQWSQEWVNISTKQQKKNVKNDTWYIQTKQIQTNLLTRMASWCVKVWYITVILVQLLEENNLNNCQIISKYQK